MKSGKIIDIEIQVANTPEMKERIIFYIAKMVTEQIGDGDDYDSIKQVVSIVITDFELIENRKKYHHRFTLYDPSDNTEFSSLAGLHTLELGKLPAESDDTELYDWLRFIKAERKEELDMLAQTNPQINKAVGVLMELSADERARMLYESREKARRDEASRTKGAVKDIARRLLKRNRPLDEIVEDTGLSRGEIENLRNDIYER